MYSANRFVFFASVLTTVLLVFASDASAQTMRMPGMENSVGFLSSGTSLEPLSTSESNPMVHGTWRDWTVMFHGVVFVPTTQQTGPRGHDKTFSTNWFMPMLSRQFGRHLIAFRT